MDAIARRLPSFYRSVLFVIVLGLKIGGVGTLAAVAQQQPINNTIRNWQSGYLAPFGQGNNARLVTVSEGAVQALQDNFFGIADIWPGGWSAAMPQWKRHVVSNFSNVATYENSHTGKYIDIDCATSNPGNGQCRAAPVVQRDDLGSSPTTTTQQWRVTPVGPCTMYGPGFSITFPSCTQNIVQHQTTNWCMTANGPPNYDVSLQDCAAPNYPPSQLWPSWAGTTVF